MKLLISYLLVLTCLLTSMTIAAAHGNDNPNEQLKAKVTKMIKQTDVSSLQKQSTEALVEFIVTNEQEIVVTKVTTKSIYLENAIKERLNYKTVSIDGLKRNQPYRLKVTFLKHV